MKFLFIFCFISLTFSINLKLGKANKKINFKVSSPTNKFHGLWRSYFENENEKKRNKAAIYSKGKALINSKSISLMGKDSSISSFIDKKNTIDSLKNILIKTTGTKNIKTVPLSYLLRKKDSVSATPLSSVPLTTLSRCKNDKQCFPFICNSSGTCQQTSSPPDPPGPQACKSSKDCGKLVCNSKKVCVKPKKKSTMERMKDLMHLEGLIEDECSTNQSCTANVCNTISYNIKKALVENAIHNIEDIEFMYEKEITTNCNKF